MDRSAQAAAVARSVGLEVDDVVILNDSNAVTALVRPADVVVRLGRPGPDGARLADWARRLTAAGAPVGGLDPRVADQPVPGDGSVVTFWVHHPASAPTPATYAAALGRLHAALRTVDLAVPRALDRAASAEAHVRRADGLDPADRDALLAAFAAGRRALDRADDQLLHGEPHPGNLVGPGDDPVFIDLETLCRGPVEFDLAHVPRAVADEYPGADGDLLAKCRRLVLAVVAGWRLQPDDRLPRGPEALRRLLAALRTGPPWPALDEVSPGASCG